MNRVPVDQSATDVLYEGYNLYPYRPLINNCQRWTFDGVYPHECCDVHDRSSRSSLHIESFMEQSEHAQLDLEIRFLHITDRKIACSTVAGALCPSYIASGDPTWKFVDSIEIGGIYFHRWQEAVERRIICEDLSLLALVNEPEILTFAFPATQEIEPLSKGGNEQSVVLVREQLEVRGLVMAYVDEVQPGMWKLILQISNDSKVPGSMTSSRRELAQRCSFASTNVVMEVRGSQFISLTDAPADNQPTVFNCRNDGTWPVPPLDIYDSWEMLASAISVRGSTEFSDNVPGDFYDGIENDEMKLIRDAHRRQTAADEFH